MGTIDCVDMEYVLYVQYIVILQMCCSKNADAYDCTVPVQYICYSIALYHTVSVLCFEIFSSTAFCKLVSGFSTIGCTFFVTKK
jgi:hypothetical protein